MAQIAAITLKDAANVDKTHRPDIAEAGKYSRWVDGAATSLATQIKVTLQKSETKDRYTVKGVVSVPLTDINGVVYDTAYGSFEFKVQKKATATDKDQVLNRVRSLITQAVVTSAVKDLEMPW